MRADHRSKIRSIQRARRETPAGCCIACDLPVPRGFIHWNDPECRAFYFTLWHSDPTTHRRRTRIRRVGERERYHGKRRLVPVFAAVMLLRGGAHA